MRDLEPVTGVLLVGGASSRFGSPKALARIDDETLAERAWRLLGDAFPYRLAVGKRADAVPLPFAFIDDGSEVRAPIAGMVSGLRSAPTDLCVVVPVDCPDLDRAALHTLARACEGAAAVPQTGPLPGAYRRSALPVLERRLAAGELRLRDAARELAATTVTIPARVLRNVNTSSALEPPPHVTTRADVTCWPGGRKLDVLAVEEPLEIRIHGQPVAVTMRTPGHDEELALGFAVGEGLDPVAAAPPADLAANAIELVVRSFDPERLRRHFYTSSSCGVCGKGALAAVAVAATPSRSQIAVEGELLASLPERLRAAQEGYAATGGLHAAGLFGEHGDLLCAREDVGRHNALDKTIGWAFVNDLLPLARRVLCVSGRLSFELVQKAAVAGCPVLVGVGAPSSLAVELAAAQNVTLCGFARQGHLNIYSAPERVARR